MRKDLQIFAIPEHTQEWYDFRRNGIGGSEIGTVLSLNKYDTVVRLFHEKVGTVPPNREDNERMFWGRKLEDEIAEVWKYYDGTDDGYIENYKNGRMVRDCRKVNGYIVNPKYPWLFASVDRLINIKNGVNFITGKPLLTEGILECKTLSYWMSQVWLDGMPIYHLAQIHQYMAILETDYAEIVILKDGNDFKVEKIERDEVLCQRIIEISRMFWENRVLPAKEAFEKKMIAQREGNIREVEKWEAVIQRHEPDPDNSEAYKEFIEGRFLKERETMDGSIDHYDLCKRDTFLRKFMARLQAERRGIKNLMLRDFNKYGVEVIDFGRLGNVTWSEKKRSKHRTFAIRIKELPSDEKVESEFKKLNQSYRGDKR